MSRLSVGEKLGIGSFLLVAFVICGCLFGYVSNIVKLTRCDFEAPYKAEICRGVGIIIPPVGVIEGLISIRDGKK